MYEGTIDFFPLEREDYTDHIYVRDMSDLAPRNTGNSTDILTVNSG